MKSRLFAMFFFATLVLFSASSRVEDGWQSAGKTGEQLPEFVKAALKFVPAEAQLSEGKIVALINPSKYLLGYLTVVVGYSSEVARETVEAVKELSEFTLDNQFPVFVDVSSGNSAYQRMERVWLRKEHAEEMERLLASDLWHEYHHAALGQQDEPRPLEAQVKLLKEWERANLITVSKKYINSLERQLEAYKKREQLALASTR